MKSCINFKKNTFGRYMPNELRHLNLLIPLLASVMAVGIPQSSLAQFSRDDLVATYIYRISQHISWPRPHTSDATKIHLIGGKSNQRIEEDLNNLIRSDPNVSRHYTVTTGTSINIPRDTKVLFLAKERKDDFPALRKLIAGKEILLISDDVSNPREIFIDLYELDDNRLRFRINKANILNQGLEIDPDIILLGGTEIDIAKLYREGQTTLEVQSRQIQDLSTNITTLQKEKSSLQASLVLQKRKFKELDSQLKSTKLSLNQQNLLLDESRRESESLRIATEKYETKLREQSEALKISTNKLGEQKFTIEKHREKLLQQAKEIADQQLEYDSLRKHIESQETLLDQQTKKLRDREIHFSALQAEIRKREQFLDAQSQKISAQRETIETQEVLLKESGATLSAQKQVTGLIGALAAVIFLFAVTLLVSNRQRRKDNIKLSEQKSLLQDNARALEDAMQKSEAANLAKSTFLANMSHELRTPLNAILGFTELLIKNGDASRNQLERLQVINASGEHLLTMINDILDLSKIEAGKTVLEKTDFEVLPMLNDVVAMVSNIGSLKGLEIELECDSAIPKFIRTDLVKLRQILINLMGNAVKFTHEGSVTLRVKADTDKKLRLEFRVEDSGIGISQDQLNSVFEPFVQNSKPKTSSQGTGLGLAISKSFIEMLGGEIVVDSIVGVGSTFKFWLPVDIGSGDAASNGKDESRSKIYRFLQPSEAGTILIAEDDEINRKLLLTILEMPDLKPRPHRMVRRQLRCSVDLNRG